LDCGLVDTDGDGLNDVWEVNGYVDIDCNGQYDEGVDTPLPESNKNKPNIYVKWDYMVRTNPVQPHSHQPSENSMDWAKRILAEQNIILHYYPTSDVIAEHAVVSASPPGELLPACTGDDAVSFYTIKAEHFPSYLAPAYHYGLFAHCNTCRIDSCASCPITPQTVEIPSWDTYESGGIALRPGNDFIVSLGFMFDIGATPGDSENTGVFLHQLGHNLGLRNGGGDDLDGKPNYISLMNTSYEYGIAIPAPWIPASPWSCAWSNPVNGWTLGFSTFTANTLHEGTLLDSGVCGDDGSGGLDETVGVTTPEDPFIAIPFNVPDFGTCWGPSAGHPIDWDANGLATDQHVFSDVSGDGKCTDLPGFNDMERTASASDVTKFVHLQMNAVCAPGYWTNGMAAQP
jgi:hypothetical protein